MSIWTSLYTGSSGLEAHGNAISVVGDNIANVDTIGYRSSRAGFDEVIGGAAANGQNLGAGVRMEGTSTGFGQGSLSSTGRALDLAIRGNGFFAVSGNHEGQQGTFYTRDGRFSLDQSGTIVNGEGMKLQGYMVDPSGRTATTASDLTVGGVSAPRQTGELKLAVNLDSKAVPPNAWDPKNPAATSNYETSATVYDSLGNAHRMDVYFRATGNGGWEWHGMVDGGDLAGGQKGVATEVASGTMAFTPTGALQTVATKASSASFLNATPNQSITFTFGDPIAAGGTGLAGTTQFSGPSNVKSATQDGYSSGTLVDVAVAADGTVNGKFSNGTTRAVARVALAAFQSNEGLQRVSNQMFAATAASGQALVDAASTGNRGAISGASLEGSNVDLGGELVTLIAYQRAFQANSRTVTTADEMLQEVAQLKR